MNTSVPSLEWKEAFSMSTYEEFMVLLTFAIFVVAILEYVNCPCLVFRLLVQLQQYLRMFYAVTLSAFLY